MTEPLLTAREVARYLAVHTNTVKRLAKRGELKSYRVSTRGDFRFRREDIEAYLEALSR